MKERLKENKKVWVAKKELMNAKLPQLKGSSQRTRVLWRRQGRLTGYSLLHVCWRRLGTRQKKKGDSVCGFIGVRWQRVGNPTKTKAKISPTFHTFKGFFVRISFQSISECSAGKRVRPISCEQTNDKHYCFKDIDEETLCQVSFKYLYKWPSYAHWDEQMSRTLSATLSWVVKEFSLSAADDFLKRR